MKSEFVINNAIDVTISEFTKHYTPNRPRHAKMIIFSNCKHENTVDVCLKNYKLDHSRYIEITVINIKSYNSDLNDNERYLKCLTGDEGQRWMQVANPNVLLSDNILTSFQSQICDVPTPAPTTLYPTSNPTVDPTNNPSVAPTDSPSVAPSSSPTGAPVTIAKFLKDNVSETADEYNPFIYGIMVAIPVLLIVVIAAFKLNKDLSAKTQNVDDQDIKSLILLLIQMYVNIFV